jgi:subfamily B ATP-binding cassette protein HlyB/CyaB
MSLADTGSVTIDGLPVDELDPRGLRKQIGVVLQENLLFSRSVAQNIAFAEPRMPKARIQQLARLAGADQFIRELPNGYDTIVEERGLNLSGGQRQRIAIARALSRNPRILIFDEATSALDYESEQIIARQMDEIAQARTVIIIAHRLSAVRSCDRIMAMDKGKIVEEGAHEDLIELKDGIYRRLWELQAGMASA